MKQIQLNKVSKLDFNHGSGDYRYKRYQRWQ